MQVLIVSTAHWSGDPRLNRHLTYLRASGIDAEFVALQSSSKANRLANIFRAIGEMRRVKPEMVLLPDPELFILGSLVARTLGIRPVIDIHEDYGKAAAGREWIPRWLRPLVGLVASLNDRIGRKAAAVTVVAGAELMTSKAILVSNVPDPGRFVPKAANFTSPTVVYIGDVTVARGALEIAELAALLPEIKFTVIGNIGDDLRNVMMGLAGAESQLELTGRRPHSEAWALAGGALAGLSILRPLPAYRRAVATKLWEYSAAGIPPVVTDLPGQREFVEAIEPSLAKSGVDDLAALIDKLANNRSWQKSVSVSARLKAEDGWKRDRPDRAIVRAVQP